MQSLSWDNYQYVLAIYRCQTLAGAARSLGVNETTVSRRLAQTEKTLKNALFSRSSAGLVPTDSGLRIIERLERVKFEIDEAEAEVVSPVPAVGGSLRVACNSLLMNHMLVPSLPALLKRHPALACELVTISAGEPMRDCDITLRYCDSPSHGAGRVDGDNSLVLGMVEFGLFGATFLDDGRAMDQIPWLVYSDGTTKRPRDAETIDHSASSPEGLTRVRVASAEVLLSCVLAGLGKCLLPIGVGRRHPELFLLPEGVGAYHRNLVRVAQPELLGTGRLGACDEWLVECVESFVRTNPALALV